MGEKEVIFKMDEDKKKKMHLAIIREGASWKKIMNELADDWLKKHGESGNPQTTISQFDKNEVMAIPNLYEDDPKIWAKFFGHSNFNLEEYQLLDKQHKMLTDFMNKKYRELKTNMTNN